MSKFLSPANNAGYEGIVAGQIKEIVDNIVFEGDVLVDRGKEGGNIEELLRKRYQVEVTEKLAPKDFSLFLLVNWIYIHYYQNRGLAPKNAKTEERHFPFDEAFRDGAEAYWRNRFWRYDRKNQERERPALTRGYETVIVEEQQFAEDELILERFDPKDEKAIFKETQFLSMLFPKFEIGAEYKYVFGKYPLDNGGPGAIVRFYLRLNVENLIVSIPLVISKISTLFNERLIPFQLKFAFTNLEFERSDHCVLYIERRHFNIAAILLRVIYEDISRFLDSKLPYFVFEAKKGIGFGVSPNRESTSFGVFRADFIARAIIELKNDPALQPVDKYIVKRWGSLKNFYLNPQSRFRYDFSVFNGPRPFLLPEIGGNKTLAAAWYIAKLLCREAVWVDSGQCNWMSYQKIDDLHCGYRLLKTDDGLDGLQGVITFLQGFVVLNIQDKVLMQVLEGAENFYKATNSGNLVFNNSATSSITSDDSKEDRTFSERFASKELREEVRIAISGDEVPRILPYGLLAGIIKNYVEVERPLGNMLDGSDHFCADIRHGFAAYGYAFLRLHDPVGIARLKL